jgi:UDP-N-acetylglucosamine 4,6-dehydratase
MRILITGGAGFLGRELTRQILAEHPDYTVIVYSRDEGKHQSMRAEIPEGGDHGARYMLGDICDHDRLRMAIRGVDQVYHCAAMKMIDACEYDSMEAARVNVDGTRSVIRACILENVRRAIHIGTDKAVDPVSVYGKTKALAESLWVQANTYGKCEFLGVRYGNVAGAHKSVFHLWAKLRKEGKSIPVTSETATRFYWHVKDAARFVQMVMASNIPRGCVVVPAMTSYHMIEIAENFGESVVVGWRCPEKEHEILWSEYEEWMKYAWVSNPSGNDKGSFGAIFGTVITPFVHSWTSEEYNLQPQFQLSNSSEYCTHKPIPDYLRPEAYE